MRKVKFNNSDEEVIVGKIVCVGQNYSDHINEMGGTKPDFPVVFLKPTSALIYSGDKVIHPAYSNNLHHEAELVLLIGKTIKDVDMKTAEKAIAGYTIGLDMTLRDLQKAYKEKGDPWTLSKGFDTSAVVGEFINVEEKPITDKINILLKVNNEVKQNESIAQLIFNPAEIVQYLASKITLEAGDLVFTGTPAGVSRVVPGDVVYAELTNLVSLQVEIIN